MSKNLNKIVENVFHEIQKMEPKGAVANYIPELSNTPPNKLGVYISQLQNPGFGMGDFQEKFSIQSMAKVLSLSLAFGLVGDEIWKRVGVEPSGNSFNSLTQLEAENGIPRNPFINAGALVICDILLTHLENPKTAFLEFVHSLSTHKTINYSSKIARSEKSVGFRNIALCNFLKSFGNIHNNPADVLDFYFDLCSLEMSCLQASDVYLFLANDGKTNNQKEILTVSQSKRINALMQTCGFYDESGEFTFKVGLPGKSGVGGGIVAIRPHCYSIVVWSPELNIKGNSYKGMCFLEQFTSKSETSIF